jgi:hypothetical protein
LGSLHDPSPLKNRSNKTAAQDGSLGYRIQSSVRKGEAGKLALLNGLQAELFAQTLPTAAGALTS